MGHALAATFTCEKLIFREKFFDGFYWINESIRLQWQRDESVMRVKFTGGFIFCIHNDHCRSNFARVLQYPAESIRKKHLTYSAPAKFQTDGKPTKQGGRNVRVAGQLFHETWRKVNQPDDVRRERVVARDNHAVGSQNKYGSHAVRRVLACILLKISVERIHSASEDRTVVPRTKRLNPELRGGIWGLRQRSRASDSVEWPLSFGRSVPEGAGALS